MSQKTHFFKAKSQALSFFAASPFSFMIAPKIFPFLIIFKIVQLVNLYGGKA